MMDVDSYSFTTKGIHQCIDLMFKIRDGYDLDEEEMFCLSFFFYLNPDIHEMTDNDDVLSLLDLSYEYLLNEFLTEE